MGADQFPSWSPLRRYLPAAVTRWAGIRGSIQGRRHSFTVRHLEQSREFAGRHPASMALSLHEVVWAKEAECGSCPKGARIYRSICFTIPHVEPFGSSMCGRSIRGFVSGSVQRSIDHVFERDSWGRRSTGARPDPPRDIATEVERGGQ